MNKALKALGIIAVTSVSLLTTYTNAAQLTSDKGLEILAVDGQEVEKVKFQEERVVDLSEGKHQIVWRYYNEVRDGNQRTIFSTTPFVAPLSVKSDDNIELVAPDLFTMSQARAYFRRSVDWQVKYSDGKTESLDYQKLTGEGLMPFANIENAVAEFNKKQGNEFAPVQAAPVYAPSIAQQKIHTNPADDSLVQTVQMLYQNASEEQKKRIRMWIAAQ